METLATKLVSRNKLKFETDIYLQQIISLEECELFKLSKFWCFWTMIKKLRVKNLQWHHNHVRNEDTMFFNRLYACEAILLSWKKKDCAFQYDTGMNISYTHVCTYDDSSGELKIR